MKKLSYLLLLIIFLACNTSNTQWGNEEFLLSPEDALKVALSEKDLITPDAWQELKSDSRYQLVDIRSASVFQKGHLDEAVNIPLESLLEDENLEFLRSQKSHFVLIGEDQLEANGPWFLLRQMGVEKLSVLQGGYSYLSAVAAGDSTANYLSEAPAVDFAVAFKESVERNKKDEEAAKPKVKPRPVAKKQIQAVKKTPPKKPVVVEEEEGC
jgi:3-mercaptopyruvate sulfurtransferase SseA